MGNTVLHHILMDYRWSVFELDAYRPSAYRPSLHLIQTALQVKGIDTTICNKHMITPMLLAVWEGQPVVVELLLESSENTLRSPGLYGLVEAVINAGYMPSPRISWTVDQIVRVTSRMLKLRMGNCWIQNI
jgi:hypothetical protein